MSDGKNLYVLKQPVAIEAEKVFNGQVYELPFRQWGMKNNHSCISQETLDEFFVPVSDLSREKQPSVVSENLKQQIEELLAQVLFANGLHPGVDEKDAELLGELKDAVLELIQRSDET